MKYSLIGLLISALFAGFIPATAQDFHFDSIISRPVLENYLSRSISFTELLHDDLTQPRDERGVDPHDNLRLILDSKAKFVGRALMLWGHESNLARLSGDGKTLRRNASSGGSGYYFTGSRI